MPTQVNTSTDTFRKHEGDVLGNGNDGTTSLKATASIVADAGGGFGTLLAAVEGDLRNIDTLAEVTTVNFTANTSGNSTAAYSRNFLLRAIATLFQAIVNPILRIDASSRATLTAHATGSSNATTTLTIAAPGGGNYLQLQSVMIGYSQSSATLNTVATITSSGLTTISRPITSDGNHIFPFVVLCPVNTSCVITLPAGGAGVVGYVSATYSIVTI